MTVQLLFDTDYLCPKIAVPAGLIFLQKSGFTDF